jgi:hypothetical protein
MVMVAAVLHIAMNFANILFHERGFGCRWINEDILDSTASWTWNSTLLCSLQVKTLKLCSPFLRQRILIGIGGHFSSYHKCYSPVGCLADKRAKGTPDYPLMIKTSVSWSAKACGFLASK